MGLGLRLINEASRRIIAADARRSRISLYLGIASSPRVLA
jgi:hypothetical protein